MYLALTGQTLDSDCEGPFQEFKQKYGHLWEGKVPATPDRPAEVAQLKKIQNALSEFIGIDVDFKRVHSILYRLPTMEDQALFFWRLYRKAAGYHRLGISPNERKGKIRFPTPHQQRVERWLFDRGGPIQQDIAGYAEYMQRPLERHAFTLAAKLEHELLSVPEQGDQTILFFRGPKGGNVATFAPASLKISPNTFGRKVAEIKLPSMRFRLLAPDLTFTTTMELKGPLGQPMESYAELLSSRQATFYDRIAHSKPLAVAAHTAGSLLSGGFLAFDLHRFFSEVAFASTRSAGNKIAHGSATGLSTASFVASIREMLRYSRLGAASAGLGGAAGMVFSAIDLYETQERYSQGIVDETERNLSMAGLALTAVPTAVFGVGAFATLAPAWMAVGAGGMISAAGIGIYRAVRDA